MLIERHESIGTEMSSRNSEVIHAGIYYGASSLKARMCLRGKELLYKFCADYGIEHKRTGKWIVAQTMAQREALEKVYKLCVDEIGVPMRWVTEDEVRRNGEGVQAAAGALESPTTGIVDSHGLMTALLGLFEDSGGVLAVNSPVQGIRPLDMGKDGWEVDVRDGSTGEVSTISAETIVNAAGLGAADVYNMIVPQEKQRKMYYAKGNYFSYGASVPSVSRLIYPAPDPTVGGLGTHLTLDLAGRMRFGPDVEWVSSPDDLAVNPARLKEAVAEIKKYLPGVDESALNADYAGMRAKLAGPNTVGKAGGFHDFIIQMEPGYHSCVTLLGIESPGLTSSLGIAQEVERLLYGTVGKV